MLVMQGEGSSYNRVSCSLPATPNYVDVDDKKKEKKKKDDEEWESESTSCVQRL